MKKLFAKKEQTNLEKVIDDLLEDINIYVDDTAEKVKMAKLKELYLLKEMDSKNKVSKDTMAVVAGNLLGIALILNYEKAGIITSKAVGFIIKGRA